MDNGLFNLKYRQEDNGLVLVGEITQDGLDLLLSEINQDASIALWMPDEEDAKRFIAQSGAALVHHKRISFQVSDRINGTTSMIVYPKKDTVVFFMGPTRGSERRIVLTRESFLNLVATVKIFYNL